MSSLSITIDVYRYISIIAQTGRHVNIDNYRRVVIDNSGSALILGKLSITISCGSVRGLPYKYGEAPSLSSLLFVTEVEERSDGGGLCTSRCPSMGHKAKSIAVFDFFNVSH